MGRTMSGYDTSGVVIRHLAGGVGFCEGPVVTPDGEIFVTSIDHGRVYRISAGAASPFAETGGGANGAALDADGTLYIAQNGGRWAAEGPRWAPDSVGGIQRVGRDGTVHWVTREPIAPNDLCFGPDGLLYVTDPTRAPRTPRRPVDGRLWRVDPRTGETELLLSVPWFTNGIAFGPDDRLYVAATHTATIYAFGLTADGLDNGREVLRLDRGGPDGMAFDEHGNLVIGAVSLEDGAGTIQTWSPEGMVLDTFSPGPAPMYTNVAFTADGDLVITGSSEGTVLLATEWPARGLPLYPFR
jgi:gluconolactonase